MLTFQQVAAATSLVPARRGQTALDAAVMSGLTAPSDPLGWTALSAFARVVTTPDGRSIRTIITGRKRIPTGSYTSRKARRAFPYEGMNEQAFFMHSEVDTQVVDYRAQPFRFEFVIDGRNRTYIADCVRLLDDGCIEVVEVKNDRRALRDPDYALKLDWVKRVCGLLGWRFRVVFGHDLRLPSVVYQNVVQIQERRMVSFGAAHAYVAIGQIERDGGQTPLGRLAQLLGGAAIGTAITQAMMVARILKIDLGRPLGADSTVRLVDSCAQTALSEGGMS